MFSACFLQAVQAMVQQAMQYIDQTPDLETKIELIKTLNNVSAGKVRSVVHFSCDLLLIL